MNIITWNVNGIRAAERKKELQKLVDEREPDVLMLQETKSNPDQLSQYLKASPVYRQYYSSAEKAGYAGTGIWIRNSIADTLEDVSFSTDLPGNPNADEGRVCHLSFRRDGELWDLLSIYFPNGGKSEQAWQEKLVFYDRVHDYMNTLRSQGHLVLVGGDMNVAHNEIDLARPKENDGKIGFHPSERAWMDRLQDDGWADVWRARNAGVTGVYSWWHMISRARDRNVGWRIDYFLMDAPEASRRVRSIDYLMDQMGSDHCPVAVEIG